MSALPVPRHWKIGFGVALVACLSAAFQIGSDAGARTAATPTPRLAYSTASSRTVQPQPPPGWCHVIGSGLYSRPDPRCTPGALNPQVTQATIRRTICKSGWTSTVRPPEAITEQEKFKSMASYGDHGSAGRYEYDHFVPLELGGAANDRRNLWPEPGASPNPKDAVEDQLNSEVCDGKITLARAQHLIVTNWVALAHHNSSPPPAPSPTSSSANCTASAQWNSSYSDYDVYVHSNQPDETVTVTAADGKSATWRTDSSGYADVYVYDSHSAAGEQVTVRVGGATCHATL
jgi:hypothetical protein